MRRIPLRFLKKKVIWLRLSFYTRRPMWKYLFRYKKIKRRFRWRRRWKFLKWSWHLRQYRRFKYLYKFTKIYFTKSRYKFHRRYFRFGSLRHIWFHLCSDLLYYKIPKTNQNFFPKWRKFRYYRAQVLWRRGKYKFYKMYKKRLWNKLRKRWIWHRLTKYSVRTNFLSNLKKYFAYNIAVRKSFRYRIADYSIHKLTLRQRLPFFFGSA